ncbi:MAG TPA: RNase adapter RapZ [Solirubrobacteraceae bacterium]|nr:RNase adapter RapZ [Solirubrobacteraceae bacterium]
MATLQDRPVDDAAQPTPLKDLVVITGFSGAGKSTAMNVFEDAGYFCVDNLPPEMIRGLVDLFRHPGAKVELACVVCDVRGGEFFEPLVEVLDDLAQAGVPDRVLFLDADDGALLTRYKETRRRHPLAADGSVAAGIIAEQAVLAPLRERADLVIDTTSLSAAALRRRVIKDMLPLERERLTVSFTSFGFKHGPLRDADLIFDVRFLPNPHYVDALRPLTGRDDRVVEYVAQDGKLEELYERLHALLDFLLPQYLLEGKAHLTIAIGCTGGRHRSVAIAEHLGARYKGRDGIAVDVVHRDVEL